MASLAPLAHHVVVLTEDALDLASASSVRRRLEQAHAGGPGRLVVDLRNCSFVDVVGLDVLLEARRRARAHGGRVVLRDASPGLERLLRLTGTHALFDVVPRVDPGSRVPAQPCPSRSA